MTESGDIHSANGQFTLVHFKDLLEKIAKPGLLQKFMLLMPGTEDIRSMIQGSDTAELPKMIAAINAMTLAERQDPRLIDHTRCHRIARGAGVPEAAIMRLLAQFSRLVPMMKQLQQSMQDPFWNRKWKRGR